MKKIFYIALALSVCTAGFGTAAQMASHSEILTLTTANDTITDQDEEEYIEEADDEFGEIPEEDEEIEEENIEDGLDFSEVKGQENVKRALEIALYACTLS